MTEPLVKVRDLAVEYFGRNGSRERALEGVSFDIDRGEAVGLLGESGCGKTTLALSLMRLLPNRARIARGSIRIRGQEILCVDRRYMRKMRGAEVSMIFQEPETALNPVMRVGEQVAEVLRAHTRWNHRARRKEAESILDQVRISRAGVYSAYPHELSGGERQRVVIAQALVCKPAFLIADEPTSALDNTIQAEVVSVLKQVRERLQTALLFITHNPLLLESADRVLIMHAGRVIEQGRVGQILREPRHSYTQRLLRSIPRLPGKRVHSRETAGEAK